MSTNWFFLRYPPSRFVIEASVRNAFWRAGFDKMWLSCVKEEPPYACVGEWQGKTFRMEWDPGVYLQLITKEPNQRLFDGFERMLKHRALAAYRLGNEVYLEWRAKDVDARLQELEASGAQDLERFNKPGEAAA
jgi:hypothetical protein